MSRRTSRSRRLAHPARVLPVLVVAAGIPFALPAHAGPANSSAPRAVSDSYRVKSGKGLVENGGHGVLGNDKGGPLGIVSNTQPAHGSLTLNPDGSFRYQPDKGFVGTDHFTYTTSNAVQVYNDDVPPLATVGGVVLTGGGYGSSLYPKPGNPKEFYGLTDRGPNVTGPDGNQVEPLPDFTPAIGLFRLQAGGVAHLLKRIPLRAKDGTPYSGRVNSLNPTGETIEDMQGHALAQDPNGYDSEGLVALKDGTFWVSDEYGPFITHFSASGRAMKRLSPLDGTLPAELANRVPNRGMEGLTITPNGKLLVGLMQSALQQPDLSGSNAKKLAPTRIVTYNLKTGAVHEYLYLLHDPATTGTANSEITALSNTQFLVDERDGNFATPSAPAFKRLYKIDLTGATDVGPDSTVPGATYGSPEGLTIGGHSIEDLTMGEDTAAAQSTLASDGITVVSSTLDVDIDAVLAAVDPDRTLFSHDKMEGVAELDGGKTLVISNDSDFGISSAISAAGGSSTSAPYELIAKDNPITGQQDDGQLLVIHTDKLPAKTSTATVTIHVTKG